MLDECRLNWSNDPAGAADLGHCPCVQALNVSRKMRGGAQSQLMFASDGCHYVVKFRNNPQGQRTLVNELVASALLRYLGLPAAGYSLVHVDDDLLACNPNVRIELRHRTEMVPAGHHFGSRYPVDPSAAAVYDLLPTGMLHRVVNLSHFIGMLVADKWIGNTDARQAVFFRGNIRANLSIPSVHPRRLGYLVLMIDHGLAFGGSHWMLEDALAIGLFQEKTVYRSVRSWADFEPWFGAINSVSERVVMSLTKLVPADWDIDTRPFETLLRELLERRKRLPSLIEALRASVFNPFEQWTTSVCTRASGGRQTSRISSVNCCDAVAGSGKSPAPNCVA